MWKKREEGFVDVEDYPFVDVEDYIKQTEYCALKIIFLKGAQWSETERRSSLRYLRLSEVGSSSSSLSSVFVYTLQFNSGFYVFQTILLV